MIYIREVDKLARKAGLSSVRSGWWELKPAWNQVDEIAKCDDVAALVRLRAAISGWGGPRFHGFALAVTGIALMISAATLGWSGAAVEATWVGMSRSIYVIVGVGMGLGVTILGLFGNDRESDAAAWNYLLDQRIGELRAREATAGDRGPLVTGHAEFVALKIGGLGR